MELSCAVAGGGGGGGGGRRSVQSAAGAAAAAAAAAAATATATTTATTATATTTAPGSPASPPGAPAAGLLLAGALGAVEDDEYESLPPSASFGTHMTAGAVAGILEHTVMYPVDFVKTRMQSLQPDPKAQYRSVFEALRKIVQTEGVWRPLRGVNVTMVAAGPAHALYFACYEKMKRTLSDIIHPGGNSHLANGIAAVMATVPHDGVMNPAEVVKQRMQVYNSPYKSVWDCVRAVHRTEGLGAFYRSYTTQLTMNFPFQAIHFITYEFLQEQINPQRQYNPSTHIISGAVAGAVAAAATTPLDVCKTLLNTQENMVLTSVNISGHLSGMANAFRTVYQLGGMAGYFKGVQARVIYQMPSTAIVWFVYESFKYVLTKREMQKRSVS